MTSQNLLLILYQSGIAHPRTATCWFSWANKNNMMVLLGPQEGSWFQSLSEASGKDKPTEISYFLVVHTKLIHASAHSLHLRVCCRIYWFIVCKPAQPLYIRYPVTIHNVFRITHLVKTRLSL